MDGLIGAEALAADDDWIKLASSVVRSGASETLSATLTLFRELGARSVIVEGRYIDRDFSAAYAAFYSSLFEPHLKYCRRWHFFAEDVSGLVGGGAPEEIATGLEAQQGNYLGYVVIRPVLHAPIGSAVVSASHYCAGRPGEVSVRADYPVHILGAELALRGVPVTEQDTRVGACAQSAIWTIGRHFTSRHSGPWFALPAITDLALKPMDSFVARSLPEGSEYLTPDNMVRALRGMDRHPVVYARTNFADPASWPLRPEEIVFRYLDSGIPVIIGLAPPPGYSIGHAVVAVGHELGDAPDLVALRDNPTLAESVTDFLVNDDQRGVYRRLPRGGRKDGYPWSLGEDCLYLIVPLPNKVFFKADVAERLARQYLQRVTGSRAQLAAAMGIAPDAMAAPPPEFQQALDTNKLVARTYLTFGWKYKQRALRNAIPNELKEELLTKQFPRFVWVTEFGLPNESFDHDPCKRRVRAHVVLDATGNPYGESALVVDVPGIVVHWNATPGSASPYPSLIARQTADGGGYFGKVRGQADFAMCSVQPAT